MQWEQPLRIRTGAHSQKEAGSFLETRGSLGCSLCNFSTLIRIVFSASCFICGHSSLISGSASFFRAKNEYPAFVEGRDIGINLVYVAMRTYSRSGEYERDDAATAYRGEAQSSSYYRGGNNTIDYEAIHATNSSRRRPTGYFSAITSGTGPVTDRFGALQVTYQAALERPSLRTEHLRQAMRTRDITESAIQKIQENEHARAEFQLTNWELQNYKQETAPSRQPKASSRQSSQKSGVPPFPEKHGLEDPGGFPTFDKEMWPDNRSQVDSQETLVVHRSLPPEYNNHVAPPPANFSRSQHDSASSTLNSSPGGLNQGLISQATADCTGFSQMSSSSSRFHREGDFDSRPPLSGQALMHAPEFGNQRSLLKQDLFLRVRTQEEDILQLQRRLADNAIKARGRGIQTELKILNEKHVLEKRIAGMRMAFDQQQQDLVDAASKALSYRHGILEENVRMTYALQAAEQERSTFVSFLLPLLAEYDFQPVVTDARSIVSNVKVLIQHLHEKLNLSEAKLKDSQYHLTSWRADPVYQAPYTVQSPFQPNTDPSHLSMNGLEVVPRTGYVQGQMPASPPFHGHSNGGGWNFSTVKYQHGTDTNHGVSHDHMSTFEPQAPANGSLLAQNDMRSMFPKHGTVNGPYNGNEGEETTGPGSLKDKDQTLRDTARNSPHLPMLPEEPNTFISEEDDLLPAIENFQITGEAVLGSTLQASGISINGTSLCVFQWVRHFEDSTPCYIEGAGQPEYTITADDVDACIAIQCTPLDKRGRQGNVVEVFVNETNKITCDPTMQEQIESYFSAGQTVFDVHLLNAVLDSWESATLTLKRSNYEIRTVKLRRVVINEKYNSNISITVPCGPSAQFVITSSDGNEHVLSTHEDDLRLRDMLVITMRLFQKQDQRNL